MRARFRLQSLVGIFTVTLLTASAANAQDATAGAAAQATTNNQTTATQTSSGAAATPLRSYWEPMGGFDIDTHDTGYAWFGPSYQRFIRENLRWTARAAVNYLFYEFDDDGGRTRVSGPGISTSAGLKFGGDNWFKVSAGPAFKQRTRRFFDASDNEVSSSGDWRVGFHTGADAYWRATRRANVMGQLMYETVDNFVWSRVVARQQVTNLSYTGPFATHIGAEVIGMGNEDFRTVQVGGLWEIAHVRSSAAVTLRAGYKHSSFDAGPDKTGPYFGIGYWQRIRN